MPVYDATGEFVGAAQVSAVDKKTLDKVEALLQLDGDLGNTFRYRVFVPTSRKEPTIKKAYRVDGISITAVVDVNF